MRRAQLSSFSPIVNARILVALDDGWMTEWFQLGNEKSVEPVTAGFSGETWQQQLGEEKFRWRLIAPK